MTFMTRVLRKPTVKATVLSASLLTLFLVGVAPLPQLVAAGQASPAAGSSSTLYPVQVSIQAKNLTAAASYDLVAYNSTGILVASYAGLYAEVTLQLPSGTYLLAANTQGRTPLPAPMCYGSPVSKSAGSGMVAPGAPNAGAASPAIAYPCYSSPPTEYGYAVSKVSGPTSLTISTRPSSAIPTSAVSVSVSYKNGTAVADAYIYASVVGGDWYWGDVSGLTMYAQTNADGVAHLVVPVAPVTVTASKSVQVNLPKNESTVQVNVGGQLVNVTVYYSPNYVYLSASGLLIPPQTSLSMTLTSQPYQPILYAAGRTTPGQATPGVAAVSPGSSHGPQVPQGDKVSQSQASQTTAVASIPPLPASSLGPQVSSQSPSNPPSLSLMALGTIALAGAVAAVVGIAISKARN